jgi:adenylate cyclase
VQRKLAAILAADVVGYSGMMERDETGTLTRLKENRRVLFDPKVAEHGGRIVKLMGDGALVEFASVVAAVNCALDIQQALQEAGGVPEEHRIRYRIGVNLGDVIVEGDDLYGDGVNVAARLQTLAQPGCIAVSRTVRDQVTGKLAAEFEDIGEHQVKNIERPVHVFMSRSCAAAALEELHRRKMPRVGICVLPFANISGDSEQEYFSDGITEDIITDLSKVSALSVVSRNTAFSFKGKSVDVAQVARHLKVSHVLEGSVRKQANRVRITAQLIEGATDSHIWAERYDRELSDIFAVQDEISEAIVGALKLKLLPSEKQAIEARSTTNAEAYKLYLMARHYLLVGSARHRPVVVRLCQRAVEIDPGYARAWALMAIMLSNIRVLSSHSGGDSGWEAAERALALEPNLAEAHAAKGRILADSGRYEEAWPEHELALTLDPESYEVNAAAGRCALAMRRYADALKYFEKAASILENDFWAVGMTIQVYTALGDREGAKRAAQRTLQNVEKIIAAEPDHGTAMGFGVFALAELGEKDRAKEWVERAILLDPDNVNLRYNLGCSMIRLGEFDAAFPILETVFAESTFEALEWYRKDSDLDPIREMPRFEAMLKTLEDRVGAKA